MSLTAAPPKRPPAPPSDVNGSVAPFSPVPESRRPRVLLKLFLGCLIALLCAGGAGATFVLEQVHSLAHAISANPSIPLPAGTLAPAGWGDPETLLLVGDDQRSLTKYYHVAVLPHANEMVLVRIDPSKPYISMMSIPRELMVTIYPPGRPAVTTRFNYAYTAGGIPLLVSTIKQVLGIQPNHVMVVTFGRFKRAVDEMGCVYSTVDRRYYHVNVPGDPVQYQEINLQPGYQNLCGTGALEFVSYRHDDTSLVRDARDQSFLLDVKKQYGPVLADSIGKFEQVFGQAVQTDPGLHSSTQLLNLIGTLISAQSRSIRQVQFQVNFVPPSATPCNCVTATPQQIAASVRGFLRGGAAPLQKATARVAHAVHNTQAAARLPLVSTGPAELIQARQAARGTPFPYEYPLVQDRGGSVAPVFLRDYLIHAPGGVAYPIYVAVFSAGQLGQYYDVQGTTWTTAPLLDSPDQTIHIGARTYFLYYQSSHLATIAWDDRGVVYWIRNTLTNALPNGEMLAIAEQTVPVSTPSGATRGAVAGAHARLQSAAVPAFVSRPAPRATLRETMGSIAALLVLAAMLLLGTLLLRRRGDSKALREQLQLHRAAHERLASALARFPEALAAMPAGAGASQLPAPVGAGQPPAAAGARQLPAGARTSSAPGRAQRVGEIPRSRMGGRGPSSDAAPRRRWSWAVLGSGVALLAIALGGYLFVAHGHGGTAQGTTQVRARKARVAAPALPTVPVTVLNSTSSPGAAARLAIQLRAKGVKIAGVGNLAGSRPPGLWILYLPGQRAQGARVARLLVGKVSFMAPIDPAAQAAAGTTAGVVVVIS